MILDLPTLSVATGLVVLTVGTVFILDTLVRRDSTTSRLWSLAYLAAILTSISYVLYATTPTAWWAVAAGNGAFVISAGAIWSGCRSFNGRRSHIGVVIVAGSLAAVTAALEGPDGGDWAGAFVWLLGVGVFSALSTAETFTRAMRQDVNARGLSLVLFAEATLFLARFVVLVGWGTENVVFDAYLGTVTGSIITIVLMIVGAVTMSVLRAEATPGTRLSAVARIYSRHGLIRHDAFGQVLSDHLGRAAEHRESVALLHLSLDDLEEISIAYGRAAAAHVVDASAATVRRCAPVSAVIGDTREGHLVVAALAMAPGEEIALATTLRRALLELEVPEAPGAKVTASIGAATTDRFGYAAATLSDAARTASDEAGAAGGNRVTSAVVAIPVAGDVAVAAGTSPSGTTDPS